MTKRAQRRSWNTVALGAGYFTALCEKDRTPPSFTHHPVPIPHKRIRRMLAMHGRIPCRRASAQVMRPLAGLRARPGGLEDERKGGVYMTICTYVHLDICAAGPGGPVSEQSVPPFDCRGDPASLLNRGQAREDCSDKRVGVATLVLTPGMGMPSIWQLRSAQCYR